MAGQEITEVPLGGASERMRLGQASGMSSQSKIPLGMQKAEELTSLPSFNALPVLRTKSMTRKPHIQLPVSSDSPPASIKSPRGVQRDTSGQICPKCLLHVPFYQELPHWRSIDDFIDQKPIGSGKTSWVLSARCRLTGLPVAIKIYKKEALTSANRNQVRREVESLYELRHENLNKLYMVFEDARRVTLILEYCSQGDVFKMLAEHKGHMDEEVVVVRVLAPLLRALDYLHTRAYMHRDIKPENLFMSEDGTLKLGDFGFAINTERDVAKSRLGTLDYMSPEVLQMPSTNDGSDPDLPSPVGSPRAAERGYDSKVDVWACGILAYELLCGKPPFEVPDRRETCRKIISEELPGKEGWPRFLSPESIRFINQATHKTPSKRLTAGQLLQHTWIKKYTQRAAASRSPAKPDYPGFHQVSSPQSVLDLHQLDVLSGANTPASARKGGSETPVGKGGYETAPGKGGKSMPRHLAALFAEALQSGSHCCTPTRGSESSAELIAEGGGGEGKFAPGEEGVAADEAENAGGVLGMVTAPFRLFARLLIG
ncbi:hypothetical protein KFL_002660030 [Klebsormidium nitens]|uniref:Protein kinase domain-containing protein n=1 Tax=Klebsormidium nitens TaxID=105231 RepID=A0A1Y1I7U9_KLENI|nr:hypothetical protein KFL_002660030 [Klebsormidium nitens]|eukprot:GAQ86022.1 hypothetical protein KFL_002660030 [Klebsormidium nitens]